MNLNNYAIVNIHRSQRGEKLERRKNRQYYCLTPPKYILKTSLHNTYRRVQKKMGYDFDQKEVGKKLKWMKQQFEDKMTKYLGSGVFVKKTTRMDKVKRKDELNFKIEFNPIIKLFTKVNRLLELKLLQFGFQQLFQ